MMFPRYDALLWIISIFILFSWLVGEVVQNPVKDVADVRSARVFPPFPFYVGDKYDWTLSQYTWADFDDTTVFKMGWFVNWNGDTFLSDMPILGTHQSLTYSINSVVGLFAKTQRLTLDQQLKVGVRFFDLRFKVGDDGKLHAFHDVLPLNISWDFVWRTFLDFLDTNDRESILVTIRDESYKNHAAVVKTALDQVPDELRMRRFVHNDEFKLLTKTALNDLRRKVIVVNFDGSSTIPWSDNTNFKYGDIFISDHYSFDGSADPLKAKIEFVREVYGTISSKNFNIVFNTLQNKSFAQSVRWNGTNLRREFLAWRKQTKQPIKGCVVMYDWL